MRTFKRHLTYSFLKREYEENKRSSVDIAQEVGCDPKTVRRYLKKFGIKMRTQVESVSKKKRVETEEEKMKRREEMIKQADKLMKEGRALLKESRLSPTEREQLRLKEGYKRKKKELKKLQEKIRLENQRATGSWTHDEVAEQLAEIMYQQGEKI